MRRLLIVMTVCTATAALAHEGVKNPAVMARMHGMKDIASDVKVLGDMAKGTTAFDQAAARVAATSIARHAGEAPGLFEAREDDPKSEALPAIWDNFADFTEKSLELEAIALGLSETIASPDDLRPALQQLGGTCKACHEVYRKP
ncbi:MAG: c-type cytochrome [Paracoccaceae bacterium]